MKNTLSILFIIVILSSCGKSKIDAPRPIEKAEWLLGTWENASPDGKMTETWIRENDSVFSGQAFYITAKNDTLHSETIALNESDDILVYTPIVQGQNDGKPVSFKLTSSKSNQLTFENPAHDFPKKIVYTKITNDSIVAEISGIQQEKPSSEKFPLKRKIAQ